MQFADDARRVLVEAAAGIGQAQTLAEAVDQGQLQRFFELPDLHRYGRLAQMQFLARAHEAQVRVTAQKICSWRKVTRLIISKTLCIGQKY